MTGTRQRTTTAISQPGQYVSIRKGVKRRVGLKKCLRNEMATGGTNDTRRRIKGGLNMTEFDILAEVEKIETLLDEMWTSSHSEDVKEIKKSLYRIVNNYALIESRGP